MKQTRLNQEDSELSQKTSAQLIARKYELRNELQALNTKGKATVEELRKTGDALVQEIKRIKRTGTAILTEIRRIEATLAKDYIVKEF